MHTYMHERYLDLILFSRTNGELSYKPNKIARAYVTGSGILGLMEALVEIWVFTFFESLISLKYTGKILDLLSQNS